MLNMISGTYVIDVIVVD